MDGVCVGPTQFLPPPPDHQNTCIPTFIFHTGLFMSENFRSNPLFLNRLMQATQLV